MRKTYDFSNAKPNPYAKLLKRQVTIRLDEPTLAYFKTLSSEMAIPYQTLINLYLRECAASHKHLRLAWETPKTSKSA
jgi:predicted DNA binding CopG/RHH family protein